MAEIVIPAGTAEQSQFNTMEAARNVLEVPSVGSAIAKGDNPGFFATAGEMYMQETFVGDWIRYGIFPSDKYQANWEYDENGFNPYKYWWDNQDKFTGAEEWLRSRMFDDVVSQEQFEARFARLTEQKEARDYLGRSESILGGIVGGLASFADVSTLLPAVGWAKKGNTAWKISRWALNGAYFQGAQELGLRMRQELRTNEESINNIGMGALIGGGLGIFGRALDPTSPLYYKGAMNPMNPNNPVLLGVGRVGDSIANSIVLRPVIKGGKETIEAFQASSFGKSVGAAAVQSSELIKSGATKVANPLRKGVKLLGRAGEAVITKSIGKAIPLVRMATDISGTVRDITQKLFDYGGLLTQDHRRGVGAASAEDFKARVAAIFEEGIMGDHNNAFTALRVKLAEITGKAMGNLGLQETGRRLANFGKDVAGGPMGELGGKNRDWTNRSGNLLEEEFANLQALALKNDITDDVLENLVQRFGEEGKDAIVKAANEMAERIHKANEVLEQLMIDHGMLNPKDKLGRDYGYAQLWIGAGVRGNRDGARQFFIRLLAGDPPEDFLMENYGLTKEQFDKLGKEPVNLPMVDGKGKKLNPDTGKYEEVQLYDPTDLRFGERYKTEILEDWSGELKNEGVATKVLELKLARDAEKRTRREAVLAARELRTTETDLKNATVEEAETILKRKFTIVERAKKIRERLRAERGVLENAEKAFAEELRLRNQRKQQLFDPKKLSKEQTALEEKRRGTVKAAEDALARLEGRNAEPAKIKRGQEKLTAADNELANTFDDILADAQKQSELPITSERITRLKERMRALDQRINSLDNTIGSMTARLEHLNQKVQTAKSAKDALKSAVSAARKAKAESAKGAKKAKREVKVAGKKLAATENRAPVHVYVDDLLLKLGDRQRDPFAGADSELFESGRTKRRIFKLDSAQRREAVSLGILRDDLYGILQDTIEDLSSRLSLRMAFGNMNEKDLIAKLTKDINDDYDQIIAKAVRDGRTDRHIQSIRKRRDRRVEDVKNGILRHLGVLGMPKDSEGWFTWLGKTARAFNYVRYGSGFLLPSTTDMANVVFTSGWGTYSYKNLRALRKMLSGMTHAEIQQIATASERILHASRTMKLGGMDDMKTMSGIGDHGTIKHHTTASIDRLLGGLSEATNVVSGMTLWNSWMKALAMINMQHKFVEYANTYDALAAASAKGDLGAEAKLAHLASLGMDAEVMTKVQALMKKYPPIEEGGLYELGMDRWLAEGEAGQDAYQAVLTGLRHTAQRAIMTPGHGDTPYWMSNQMGKVFGQFQTYGFASVSRFVLPAFQRMATYGDLQAFMSLNLAAALGTLVVMAKDIQRDGKIKDRSAGQWAYDIVDRSGILMYLSAPLADAKKFLNIGGGETSRYSMEKDRLSLLLGPTGGLVSDVLDMKDAITTGDVDRATRVGTKLMPFSFYARIGKTIYDKIDN
jgi:hypothetical protein